MTSITDVRTAIETQLATVPYLRVEQEWGSGINVTGKTAVAVVQYSGTTYDTAFDGGGSDYIFGIVVLAGRVSERVARDRLDEFSDSTPDSATAIRTYINGTLGGVVQSAVVRTGSEYREYTPGEIPYLGCEFLVGVMV